MIVMEKQSFSFQKILWCGVHFKILYRNWDYRRNEVSTIKEFCIIKVNGLLQK